MKGIYCSHIWITSVSKLSKYNKSIFSSRLKVVVLLAETIDPALGLVICDFSNSVCWCNG